MLDSVVEDLERVYCISDQLGWNILNVSDFVEIFIHLYLKLAQLLPIQ